MNDKIRELTEQVDIIKRPNMSGLGWDYTLSENQLKMFAESIINECAKSVEYILKEGGGNQGDLIKEHFGVE